MRGTIGNVGYVIEDVQENHEHDDNANDLDDLSEEVTNLAVFDQAIWGIIARGVNIQDLEDDQTEAEEIEATAVAYEQYREEVYARAAASAIQPEQPSASVDSQEYFEPDDVKIENIDQSEESFADSDEDMEEDWIDNVDYDVNDDDDSYDILEDYTDVDIEECDLV